MDYECRNVGNGQTLWRIPVNVLTSGKQMEMYTFPTVNLVNLYITQLMWVENADQSGARPSTDFMVSRCNELDNLFTVNTFPALTVNT